MEDHSLGQHLGNGSTLQRFGLLLEADVVMVNHLFFVFGRFCPATNVKSKIEAPFSTEKDDVAVVLIRFLLSI